MNTTTPPAEESHFHSYVVLLNLTIIASIVALWYRLWLKPGYCTFPIGKYSFENLLENGIYRTDSFVDFWSKFGKILVLFEADYWIPICGPDTYLYLYCQRQILLFISFLLVLYFSVKLYIDRYLEVQEFSLFRMDVTSISFEKHTVLLEHLFMISCYTIGLIIIIVRMVKHFSKVLAEYYEKENKLNLKYLQLRTLHIQGMLPEDIEAEVLRTQIDKYLLRTGGKMIAIKILPNYSKLFDLETQRRDLIITQKILDAHHPDGEDKGMWVPKKYCEKDLYEAELREIDEKIQNETERRFLSSGHAFICFDSAETAESVKKFFDLGLHKVFDYTFETIQNRMRRLTNEEIDIRKSNFHKFHDERQELKEKYQEVTLFVRHATEPLDIIWQNLSGFRGIVFYRKIFVNALTAFFLIFFSTPYVLLHFFSEHVIDLEEYGWAYKISNNLGRFMHGFIPPFVTLFLNFFLLDVITMASAWERNFYHSEFQKSNFKQLAIYVMFSMAIVPGFAITEHISVFKVFQNAVTNPKAVLRNFYAYNSGSFFASILAQATIWTAISYLVRLSYLTGSYFSPWVVYYKQEFINNLQNWSKRSLDVFPYGYLLAQSMTVFFLASVFSTTIPLLILMGLIYFVFRHTIDAMNLLFLHKKELDSLGSLIKLMLMALVLCGALFQFCFFGVVIDVGSYIGILVMAINISALIGLYLYLKRPFFDLINLKKESDVSEVPQEFVRKWQEMYKHPLVLKSNDKSKSSVSEQIQNILNDEIVFESSPKKTPLRDSHVGIELRHSIRINY